MSSVIGNSWANLNCLGCCAELTHGTETFSFEYSRAWLEGDNAMSLDPELQLFQGPQYSSDNERPNFGLFLDSSPDRWGQLLMKRREARDARREQRKPKTLLGSDFLLGVHDQQRMGGLRFKTEPDGVFLSDEQGQNAPPWARLRNWKMPHGDFNLTTGSMMMTKHKNGFDC